MNSILRKLKMSATTYDPSAIFLDACKSGDVARVIALVERHNLSETCFSRGLQAAANRDHVNMVRCLLERGVKIEPYWLPLAAARAGSLEIFKLLVEYGWDVKAEGHRVLLYTVQHESIVRYLLELGASPFGGPPRWDENLSTSHPKFDHNSGAALNNAAASSSFAVVEMLLAFGAPIEAAVPLHMAAGANKVDMLKRLIQSGRWLDLNALDDVQGPLCHGTPLHYAVRNSSVDAVRLLLELGADPEVKNQKDRTSKEVAAERDDTAVLAVFGLDQ